VDKLVSEETLKTLVALLLFASAAAGLVVSILVYLIKPENRRAQILGALWRLPFGLAIVIIEIIELKDILVAGSGWQLQFSFQALGFWCVWWVVMNLAVRLIYRGIRTLNFPIAGHIAR
jgi:hypothetical protein